MSGESGKSFGRMALTIGGAIVGGMIAGPAGAKMGYALGGLAGGFLGTVIFPANSDVKMPEMATYPVQNAGKTGPIQIVYGTDLAAGNVIFLGETHPYTIKHSSGGGGKGGGGSSGGETTETRFRKSFMIGICHGPAQVLRAWAGKTEIDLDAFTVFPGFNNTQIGAVIDKDFAEYKHICCAYFDEYDLGNSEQIPNFTFEVEGFPASLLGIEGFSRSSSGSLARYVYKHLRDGTLDPDWGTAGRIDLGAGIVIGAVHQDDDGNLYVTDTADAGVWKFDPDGVELWHWDNPTAHEDGANNIRVDREGNIYLMWWADNRYSTFFSCAAGIRKLDSEGNELWNYVDNFNAGPAPDANWDLITWDNDWVSAWGTHSESPPAAVVGFKLPHNIFEGLFFDNEKKMLLAGNYCNRHANLGSEIIYNLVKINTDDGSIDTSWGNDGTAYSFVNGPTYSVNDDCFGMRQDSVGNIYCMNTLKNYSGEWRNAITKLTISFSTDPLTGEVTESLELDTGYGTFGDGSAGLASGEIPHNWASTRDRFDVRPDGSLFFSGSFSGAVSDFSFIRKLNPDGTIAWTTNLGDKNIQRIICKYYKGWLYINSLSGSQQWQRFNPYTGAIDPDWSTDYEGPSSSYYMHEFPARVTQSYASDLNPATLIYDLLTNNIYGAGISTSFVNADSFDGIENFCNSNDLLFSFVLKEQKPVLDYIDFVLSHFQGYLFMSEGKINIGVFRNDSSTFTITRDNLATVKNKPPVQVTKRPYSDTKNRIEVAWMNRSAEYDNGVAVAKDETDIRQRNKIVKQTINLSGIKNSNLAQRTTFRMLFEALYRFSNYAFVLSYNDMLVEVGDVGTLSDGGQIVNQRIRILNISEAKDGKSLQVEAVEDQPYMYPDLTSYRGQDTEHIPDPDFTDLLASPLYAYSEHRTSAVLFLSLIPTNIYTNGWYVYRSYDDVSYELLGKAVIDGVTGGDSNSQGTLTSSLHAHTAIVHKVDESFLVDIGIVTDLTTVTDADFFSNKQIALIGNEVIGYKVSTEIGSGVWEVSELMRGLFNTEPVAHGPGSTFKTLSVDYNIAYPESDIGRTVFIKALTFYGNNVQDISDVSSSSHTILGIHQRPLPVSLMRIRYREGYSTYTTDDVVIDWNWCSRQSGYNVGGFNSVLWGAFVKEEMIETITALLEQIDGTDILETTLSINGIGDPLALLIPVADRSGNNTVKLTLTPGGTLAAPEGRTITIEKI